MGVWIVLCGGCLDGFVGDRWASRERATLSCCDRRRSLLCRIIRSGGNRASRSVDVVMGWIVWVGFCLYAFDAVDRVGA